MTTIEEVKAKFSSVEKINQSLKDELIRTEEHQLKIHMIRLLVSYLS